jgi:hypothetical protein
MAKYLVLSNSYLHTKGQAGPCLHTVGTTVDFDGEPGVALAPLDAEAYAARRAVIESRDPLQQDRDKRKINTFRRGLTPGVLKGLDRVTAELEAGYVEI